MFNRLVLLKKTQLARPKLGLNNSKWSLDDDLTGI